jgi:hypothetical protein
MVLLTQGDKIVAHCKSLRSARKHLEHRYPGFKIINGITQSDGSKAFTVVMLNVSYHFRAFYVRPYRPYKTKG